MKSIIFFLPATVCFVGASVIACLDKTGWGWFLFAGIITMPGVMFTVNHK